MMYKKKAEASFWTAEEIDLSANAEPEGKGASPPNSPATPCHLSLVGRLFSLSSPHPMIQLFYILPLSYALT
jgi:hypothetical protein